MKKILAAILAVVTAVGSAGAVSAAPSGSGEDADRFSSKQLLVGAEEETVVSSDAAQVLSSCEGMYLIRYHTEEEAEKSYEKYEKTAEFVSPDAAVYAASVKSGSDQKAVEKTAEKTAEEKTAEDAIGNLDEALKTGGSVSGENVIAALDTGMSGSGVADAVSMIGDATADDCGHGTKTLEAIRSMNPDASVLSIKVLDGNGRGTVASICAGIAYAIRQDVKILLLPLYLESTGEQDAVAALIRKAAGQGILVVGAAGNDGEDVGGFVPGSVSEALVAGSCDETGARNKSSNYGGTVDYYVTSASTSEASAKLAGFLSRAEGPAQESLATEAAKKTWLFLPEQENTETDGSGEETPSSSGSDSDTAVKVSLGQNGEVILADDNGSHTYRSVGGIISKDGRLTDLHSPFRITPAGKLSVTAVPDIGFKETTSAESDNGDLSISFLPASDIGEDTAGAAARAADENKPVYAFQFLRKDCSTYFFTTDPDSADEVSGWTRKKDVGIIGYSDSSGGTAIYRLRYKGTSALGPVYAYVAESEISRFESLGYTNEGFAFYRNTGSAQIYRLHNPNVAAQYMFTPDSSERDQLVRAGWQSEEDVALADQSYPKVPAYFDEPTRIGGKFIDEKMILGNESCALTSINVSGISSSDYSMETHEEAGQRGVKFRTAGAAEKAVVTARFTNAGTYRSGSERIPIDYTLTFSHGIAYASGKDDFYRPRRTLLHNGEYGLYFSDNPSLASIHHVGLLSVDCEMKLYRSSDGTRINPSGAYITFGSLNGYHQYKTSDFYDVEGVAALAPVSAAYVADRTIVRSGTYENYDKYMDPNNKGRRGYYGWQNSESDFQDGKSSKAVTYNRSCVTLTFRSAIKFAIQTYETHGGSIYWSVDAFPISDTTPDPPVKSVRDADGNEVTAVKPDQEIVFRVDQKVNRWGIDAISKYTSFEIRDRIPDGLTFQSAWLACNGERLGSDAAVITSSGQNLTCRLTDRYLLNMPMNGETYSLYIRCRVNRDAGPVMKNRAVSCINDTEFQSNEVEIVTNPHKIVTGVKNGTIDDSITGIPDGEDRTVHYAPQPGYTLQSVTVDGRQLTGKEMEQNESSYPFRKITEDHEILVVYEEEKPLTCGKQVFLEDGKTDADGKIVPVGKPLIYRITVANEGRSDATAAVEDRLPADMKFVSADEGGAFADGTVRWSSLTVPAGGSKVVSFRAVPEKAGALYRNTAVVREGDRTIESDAVVCGTIDPKKAVADESGNDLDGKTAGVGQTLVYRISFVNPLPSEAGFTVQDAIPEGTGYLSATNSGSFRDGEAVWTAKVAAGGEFRAELRVRVEKSGTFVNQATVKADDVTADTNQVTVRSYLLPIAGGSGIAAILIAAAAAAAAACVLELLAQRRRGVIRRNDR